MGEDNSFSEMIIEHYSCFREEKMRESASRGRADLFAEHLFALREYRGEKATDVRLSLETDISVIRMLYRDHDAA